MKTDHTMTSLEITSIIGLHHKHVMDAIREMEIAWESVRGSRFRLGSCKDANGQETPCYYLTKIETLFVSSKFSCEARRRLTVRWEELNTNT